MDNEIQARFGEVAVRFAEVEGEINLLKKEIKDLKENQSVINSLVVSVEKIALSVETLTKNQIDATEKIDELDKTINEVKNEPFKLKAKMHDKIIERVVLGVLGAIIVFLLAYIGIK